MMRRLALATSAALMLTACVAPSQPILDTVAKHCLELHEDQACKELPIWRAQVAAEKQQQAQEAARAAAILLLVAGAAAGAAAAAHGPPPPRFVAPPPPPIFIVP